MITPKWTRAVPIAVVVLGLLALQLAWTWTAHGQSTMTFTADDGLYCIATQGVFVRCETTHLKTGDHDLDRAVAICDAHPNRATNVIPAGPPYDPAYAGCGPVLERWDASDAARREAERKAKDAADKAWLEEYARGIKP